MNRTSQRYVAADEGDRGHRRRIEWEYAHLMWDLVHIIRGEEDVL